MPAFDNFLGEFHTYECLRCGKVFEANFKPKIHSSDSKHYCYGKVRRVK